MSWQWLTKHRCFSWNEPYCGRAASGKRQAGGFALGEPDATPESDPNPKPSRNIRQRVYSCAAMYFLVTWWSRQNRSEPPRENGVADKGQLSGPRGSLHPSVLRLCRIKKGRPAVDHPTNRSPRLASYSVGNLKMLRLKWRMMSGLEHHDTNNTDERVSNGAHRARTEESQNHDKN